MIISKDINNLLLWLKIREFNTGRFPSCADDLLLQMHKSALFQRMMEGKVALPEPPPRSFSYPWYHLIENGIGYPQEVFKSEGLEKDIFGNTIIINQFAWNLLEELGEENWIINYNFGPDQEFLSKDKWNVYRQEDESWIIKKLT
jgi:hypothetical protein